MAENNKQFVNFKIHTQYSICEGAIKIDELADYCKQNKIRSLGICDSFNLCGALEFAEKISKVGTQPIIGTQIKAPFSSSRALVLLRNSEDSLISDMISTLPVFT